MTDSEILEEIEHRLEEWFKHKGWSEEDAGFHKVQQWIEELRGAPPDGA